MKQKMIFSFLIILILGLSHANTIPRAQENIWDKDKNGKLTGKIVDAETGKPVNEKFYVNIYDCKDESKPTMARYFISKKDGTFERLLKPGKYCLEFIPESEMSKYAYDYTGKLRLYEESRRLEDDLSFVQVSPVKWQKVRINKGKVSRYEKRVLYGGRILVRVVDQNNNAIDIEKRFGKRASIRINVHKDFLHYLDSVFIVDNKRIPELNEYEYMIFRIWPGEIKLEISYDGIGYGKSDRHTIQIKRNFTHTVTTIIDFNDSTGIEGVLYDADGVAVPDTMISVSSKNGVRAAAYSNKNGFYKFFGLKSGVYRLNAFFARYGWVAMDSCPGISVNIGKIARQNLNLDIKLRDIK